MRKRLPGVDECLLMCKEQSTLTNETKKWINCPRFPEKTVEKKVLKPQSRSFQKTEWMKTTVSVFVDRTEPVKSIEIEMDLIKSIGCFLDGFANYNSKLLTFRIKTSKTIISLHSTDIHKYEMVLQTKKPSKTSSDEQQRRNFESNRLHRLSKKQKL